MAKKRGEEEKGVREGRGRCCEHLYNYRAFFSTDMKLLLIYPPFCAPTIRPYSISYLKNFVENNLDLEVKCLDLNAQFHKLRFPKYYQRLKQKHDLLSYGRLLEEFENEARDVYAHNHKTVIAGKEPELLSQMIQLIIQEKADDLAFSFVYNSQVFYGKALLEALQGKGIHCLVGGPAIPTTLQPYLHLKNEVELIAYLAQQQQQQQQQPDVQRSDEKHYNCNTIPDFSDYHDEDYLSAARLIPIKTSSTCFYKQCTFCTHYADVPYLEFNLENIKKTIIRSGAKHVCFIDDMISRERLDAIAKMMKPLGVTWWCQLRPTRDLRGHFQELQASGLRSIAWGVESGSQRILNLMKKGTTVENIPLILKESHDAGIKNMVYIMFGFPTETKEEFGQTLAFLQQNTSVIDLVSTAVFGLQKRSTIYQNPAQFGIQEVKTQPRTILDEKITYRSQSGLQPGEVKILKQKYKRSLRQLNKVPAVFDYFKEQILVFDG